MGRCAGCAGTLIPHVHPESEVTDLVEDLVNKADLDHTHEGGGGGGTGFGDSDWRIGSFVWFQKQVDFPDDTETVVGWEDTDILMSESLPSDTPFWTIPDPAGWPITYEPAVYYVELTLAVNDLPAGSTGETIVAHVGGQASYHTVSAYQASIGNGMFHSNWTIVVVDIGGMHALFPQGGEVRVRPLVGEQLDDVYVNLIVQKVGHVD